jgi:hypothetical protein
MSGVIVLMIPSAWKSALRAVIVVVVVTRDGGTVHHGGKGEEEEESASNGGEHRAGREGAHKGAITGRGSPYKVTSSWHGTDSERPLPSICPIAIIPIFPCHPYGRPGTQIPLAWPSLLPSSAPAGCHSTATFLSLVSRDCNEKAPVSIS